MAKNEAITNNVLLLQPSLSVCVPFIKPGCLITLQRLHSPAPTHSRFPIADTLDVSTHTFVSSKHLRQSANAMSPANRNPQLKDKISQMRLTIAPIVHVESGLPPPHFPSTMLQLFLLTEDQLDSMAHYYSQITPTCFTHMYPQTMNWNKPLLAKCERSEPENLRLSDYERLKIKMRMFARFIGMKGAETPGWEHERQIEVIKAKIDRCIEDEEDLEKKWYRGPPALP